MKPSKEAVERAARAIAAKDDEWTGNHTAFDELHDNDAMYFADLARAALTAAMEPIAGICCGVELPACHPQKSEFSGTYGLVRLEN